MIRLENELKKKKNYVILILIFGVVAAFSFGYPYIPSKSIQGDEYHILFAGDTSFGENYQEQNEDKGKPNILKEEGYDYSLQGLKPILLESDFVIINLETPITDITNSPLENTTKPYLHWTDITETPNHLKKYNVGAVNLANNHVLDYGQEGMIQTFSILNQSKIDWFGAGVNELSAAKEYVKKVELENENFTMVVIGAFEYRKSYDEKYSFYADKEIGGVNALSVSKIEKQIEIIKKQLGNDIFVVIFPHWGKNYAWKSEEQTNIGHQLIDAGADLIIGTGAHRLQEIEKYNDKWIIYSLGNFMFNSPGRYQESGGQPYSLVAQLVLQETEKGLEKNMKLYPIFSDNKITNYQPRLLDKKEFDLAYRVIVESSQDHKNLEKFLSKGLDDIGYFIKFGID